MADKDQIRKDAENIKSNVEPEVTELDDKAMEEASGGSVSEEQSLDNNNGNCLC